jgi:RNA polymerase sigma factor (sigma-70 family)
MPPPFQAFLESYRDDVYRFLVATVGPVEADDCFQETFLAALRAYPRLEPGSNLKAWIFTIAHRKGLDLHRRRARAPIPVEEVPENAAPATPENTAPASLDGESGIWRHVRDLPPKQRAAVAHRFMADLGYREIGAILGCSEEAARRNVHEGLKRLREVWQG